MKTVPVFADTEIVESESDILICIRDISVFLTLRLISATAFMPLILKRFLANIILS